MAKKFNKKPQAAPSPNIDGYGIDTSLYPIFTASNSGKQKNAGSIVTQLMRFSESMNRNDIRDWRNAWAQAIDVRQPRRNALYPIYRDVWADGHLSGIYRQRMRKTQLHDFYLIDKNGEIDKEKTELLKRSWFLKYTELYIESFFWGHSVVDFGGMQVNSKSNIMEFTEIMPCPREHFRPETREIVTNPYDMTGESIDNYPFAVELYEKRGDLGLLLGICANAIPKKNAANAWDEFADKFGIPMTVGKTADRDPQSRAQIKSMLEQMGGSTWALFPEGTSVEVVANTMSDAFQVFKQRIETANLEMSKAVLTVTMTTDNGASRSQSEVHADMLEDVITADRVLYAQHINDVLLPFLTRHGYPFDGSETFRFNDTKEITFDQKLEKYKFIFEYCEVDPAFYEQISKDLGVPIIGKNNTKAVTTPPNDGKTQPAPAPSGGKPKK